jgi:hypothetical protein
MEIPVFVDELTGVDRKGELLLGGVPVARGVLAAGGWFALRSQDGAEHIIEGSAAAFWPDRSIKWLHLCGLADLKGGQRNRFTLADEAAAPSASLTLETEDGCARVRGGLLDVDVSCDSRNVLRVAWAGSEEPLLEAPGLSAALTLIGPDGANRRASCWALPAGGLKVVVRTANRVVVRLGGRFDDASGRCVGEMILFVEALRETPELRLQPVFIYLGKPDEDLIASLTLAVSTRLSGDDCAYGFSNERGRGYWDVVHRIEGGPRWPEARLVQLGSSFYRLEKRTCAESSWLKAAEGRRAQGWCHLAQNGRGVTAALRYFWQEYPRSLSLNTDTGRIAFGLVPPEASPLDLRRYSPTLYGQAMYETGEGPFPSETHGACGTAKAHELMLRFHRGDDNDAAERGLFFAHPCRVLAEPRHFAATGVVGQLAAADPQREPEVERLMARTTDFLVRERDYRGWYGLMDFGDIISSYYTSLDRWAFDDGGYAWINTEHLPDLGLWLSALRSGRADWLEAAIEMSRHNRDVDTYHRGPLKGCGSRHNVNHWGCRDKEWRVSMPLVRRLHYYVTADPWTREAILETVAVYQSYERTSRTAPSMTSAFAGILTKWELTGDEADGRVVRNMADVYTRAVRQDGQFFNNLHVNLATGIGGPEGDEPHTALFFMDGFGGQHVLVEAAELLDHKGLSDAILSHVRFRTEGEAGAKGAVNILCFLAHAYRRTGDRRLLETIVQGVRSAQINYGETGGVGILDTPRHEILVGAERRNKIACWLGGLLHLLPYGLAVLDRPPTQDCACRPDMR